MTRQGSTGQNDFSSDRGQASGRHPGIRHPTGANRLDDKVENADLELRGLGIEDELGDRRGKGVAGEYDDSIGHDADTHYRGPDSADRV